MAQKMVRDEETLSEVNVIPLADVSLVLLIVLMVVSPMISQALIKVTAAQAQAAAGQQDLATPETPVLVSLEPGALKLNGTLMASEFEFIARLSAIMPRRRDKSVLLTAAPAMPHGKVVHLMDVIRRHGAQSLVMLKWDRQNEKEIPS